MLQKSSLNSKQQEAVEHSEGPLLVLAGAGSGKTRVLVERMIRLIQDRVVSPWNILAVTFTNKAAKEMKNRVGKVLGDHADRLWVSTFHSFCLRLLRRHAVDLGYNDPFAVYDEIDQKTLIKKVLKDKELDDKVYKVQSVRYFIDRAKNEAVDPDKFEDGGDYYLKKIKEIYSSYQKELLTNNAMDFGDLIVNTIRLFTKYPDVLGRYQEQFKYILIDEYQDTNLSQYILIKLLADKYRNLCVVGDDDQSIYKFRGAEIKNILGFQKDYSETKIVRLEQNYRSTKNILNAANSVIRANIGRMGKNLWTDNSEGEKIQLFGGQSERDEAGFLAQVIGGYAKDEFSFSDMAVFYRTNAQSRSIEDELRKNNIPYRIFGGIRFFDRAEIKDMMAYLKILVNPQDGISLRRILNVPSRGIGKTTVQKIEAVSARTATPLWGVMNNIGDSKWQLNINAGAQSKIEGFCALINEINKVRHEITLDDFLTYLYDKTGYWQMLKNDNSIEALSRLENLSEFVNVMHEFVNQTQNPTLESFLDQMSLASSIDEGDESTDHVTLMTIHLAKGLEFPVVFLVGMEEGLFPHARSLERDEDLEEERRLCYVGMTRAKKRLHMTFATERRLFGQSLYNFPSRFLEEIPSQFIGNSTNVRVNRSQFLGERTQASAHSFSNTSPDYHKKYKETKKPKLDQTKRVVDLSYSQADSPIRKGAWVRHGVFGDGQVLGFEGENERLKVTVKFNSGVKKKLLYKHAHLTILQ